MSIVRRKRFWNLTPEKFPDRGGHRTTSGARCFGIKRARLMDGSPVIPVLSRPASGKADLPSR